MTNVNEILHVKKKKKNIQRNKSKGVKFCPVILTKKKTNRNKQKGQLTWYYNRGVAPALPTLLLLPDDCEQPQLVSLMLELVKIGLQKTGPRCIVYIW